MSRSRTTLAEVAEAVGVSVATVSKVLNDRGDVSAATRTRVLRQLRAASYRPVGTDGARLSPRRMIEVVFPDAQNSYSIEVLRGVTETAHLHDFDVVMGRKFSSTDEDRTDVDPQLLLHAGRAGAVFITMDPSSAHLRVMRDAELPVVLVDPEHRSLENAPGEPVSVGSTNFTGGMQATEHLLALGHRRIAHAGGPIQVDCSQARLAGYSSALRQAGIALDESLITHCPFRYEAGRDAAGQLLDRDDPPTAIFAGNDEIALGVMEEARRRSIRIPDELSVVGFDDTFIATRSAPQLTTVAQPLFEMGSIAVRSLTRLIDRETVESSHIELSTTLIIRDSTAAPRT